MIFLWGGAGAMAVLIIGLTIRHLFKSERDPGAVEAARQKLFAIAHVRGWRMRGEGGDVSIEDPRGECALSLASADADGEDGDTVLVRLRGTSPVPFSVWTRDPPDAARERWGDEVEMGEVVFDARFAVLARAPRGVIAPLLPLAVREGLLDLELPTFLAGTDRVAIRFRGVPDDYMLERALGTLRAFPVADEAGPYRQP